LSWRTYKQDLAVGGVAASETRARAPDVRSRRPAPPALAHLCRDGYRDARASGEGRRLRGRVRGCGRHQPRHPSVPGRRHPPLADVLVPLPAGVPGVPRGAVSEPGFGRTRVESPGVDGRSAGRRRGGPRVRRAPRQARTQRSGSGVKNAGLLLQKRAASLHARRLRTPPVPGVVQGDAGRRAVRDAAGRGARDRREGARAEAGASRSRRTV